MKIRKHSAFTLIEMLVVISIIAILATAGFAAFQGAQRKARLSASLQNAKQIALAMKMYAGDNSGAYPAFKDIDDPSTAVANSNEAMECLMPRYTQNKAMFDNRISAWCKGLRQAANTTNQYKVLQYENDWSYVVGLTEINDSRWPLLATAFAPGGATNPVYVKDTNQRGGIWGGTDAIMIKVDCSASQEQTKDKGETYFIKRVDSPTKNAFTPDSDWLGGGGGSATGSPDVTTLNPLE